MTRRRMGFSRPVHAVEEDRRSRIHTRIDAEWRPVVGQFTVVPLVSFGIHWAIADRVGYLVTTALVGSFLTFGLGLAAWTHGSRENRELRVMGTATIAWSFFCLTVLSCAGLFELPVTVVCGVGCALTGGHWVIRGFFRAHGKTAAGEADPAAATQIKGLAEVGKAKVLAAKVNDHGTVSTRLALPPGYVARDELEATPAAMASYVGVELSQARAVPVPGQPRMVDLEIDTVDHLAQAKPWPGADSLGKSMAVPFRVGYRSDGTDALLDLTGCQRDLSSEHVMVTGMNGSGKTDTVSGGVVANGVLRVEEDGTPPLWIVLDHIKGIQSYDYLSPFIWIETDPKRIREFLRLAPELITTRTEFLGRNRFKQWRPGCRLSYIGIVMEEAWKFLPSGKHDEVALTFRSAGGSLLTSVQRATHESVSTLFAGQHDVYLAHGVSDPDDAQYGLPERLHGRVRIDDWGKRYPGRMVFAGGGQSEQEELRPVRSYQIDGYQKDIRQYIAAWRDRLGLTGGMDPVTYSVLGKLYETRPSFDESAAGPVTLIRRTEPPTQIQQPPRPLSAPPAMESIENPDPDADRLAASLLEEDEELQAQMKKARDEYLAGLSEEEREALRDWNAAPLDSQPPVQEDPEELASLDAHFAAGEESRPNYGSGELQTMWLNWVAERFRSGEQILPRSEAVDWAVRHGRSEPWADEKLARLVEGGYARKLDTGRPVRYELLKEPPNELGEMFGGTG